jgi:hypothetical protein
MNRGETNGRFERSFSSVSGFSIYVQISVQIYAASWKPLLHVMKYIFPVVAYTGSVVASWRKWNGGPNPVAPHECSR